MKHAILQRTLPPAVLPLAVCAATGQAQAATVYFHAAALPLAVPLWPWGMPLLIAALLLWLASRDRRLAHRGITASLAALFALTLAALVAVQPGQAISTQLMIGAGSPACAGAGGQLNFDPYQAGVSLYNGCATTTLEVTGYDLECSAAAQREGELPAGARLRPGQSLAVSHCDPNVNEPPRFTLAQPAINVAEDAGPQSFPGLVSGISPGPAHEAAQTVALAVTSDRPALFAAPPQLLSSGELRFTTAPDAFGSAQLEITATDSDGASSRQVVRLQVTPVNDPPSFNLVSVVTVLEDNGQDTDTVDVAFSDTQVIVPGVATAISPGNAWEANAGEAVRFKVSYLSGEYQREGKLACVPPTAMPADWFFAIPPGGSIADAVKIGADGALSMVLGADKWGEVRLEVTAIDGQGLASAPQVVQLSINPVYDAAPEGADRYASGDENASCIAVGLAGRTFRDMTRAHFLISDRNLQGGTLMAGGVDVSSGGVSRVETASLCYIPPADAHSNYDPGTGILQPFATFRFRVWSGEGDMATGESEPLGSSGQALELSPEYGVSIVVKPVF